ncbi:aldehyde ferredoxin oxidoreductase N-terminal domain-containing protein [Athalassotoga saccharophila]|uniref:aldehyde ferredoxin oxidoreductase N-terminal domain-containing protein n=1 Tax=Athalassotoga saccharophila TaxID=1441386 RepID=UPI00137AD56F|nr:aldehyde ferredoxin oxidoreductase N-terminal domain-containing protein [Athalassotoga saccharophila]BBJ28912.1 aldehyde ferredoxin oxidoreductase [Athalassotoga saccharophila]
MKNIRLLKINLSKKEISTFEMDPNLIGGKKLALELIHPSDPFSESNTLTIATGPFTGENGIPHGGRFAVATNGIDGTKSVSSTGGRFGIAMKSIGYDGMVIEGKAKDLSYIYIDHSKIEILDASYLKGTNSSECKKFLSDERSIVACIGPAGEMLLPLSVILFDESPAGRNGFGAVMGSKNLKAIKIFTDEVINDPCLECPVKCEKRLSDHWEKAGATFMKYVKDEERVKKFVKLCNDLGVDSLGAGEIVEDLPKDQKNLLDLLKNQKFRTLRAREDPVKYMMDTFGFCAFSYGILKIEDYQRIIRKFNFDFEL